MGLATLPLRALLLAACASGLQFAQRAPAVARSREVVMMGRKFENNKMKMAKTALAYAKKASYIGKQVVIAVKSGGDDPDANLQLAAVMREANALNVPKDVRSAARQRTPPAAPAANEHIPAQHGLLASRQLCTGSGLGLATAGLTGSGWLRRASYGGRWLRGTSHAELPCRQPKPAYR